MKKGIVELQNEIKKFKQEDKKFKSRKKYGSVWKEEKSLKKKAWFV